MIRLNSEFEKLENSLKTKGKNKGGKTSKNSNKKEKPKSKIKTFFKWVGIVSGGIIALIILVALYGIFFASPHSQSKPVTNSNIDNKIDAGKNNNKQVKNNKHSHPPLLSQQELKNELNGGVDLASSKKEESKNSKNKNSSKTKPLSQPQHQQTVAIPQTQSKPVVKYKTEYFCKNQTPIDNEIVYFVKIDNKMIPVYTLDNWDGRGIKFKKYGIKKVLNKITFNNTVYYEVEKGKYILNDKKKFIECYSEKIKINK